MRRLLAALREIGRMGRLRLLAVAFIVAGLACAASAPAFANILIQIDKPSQTMTVSVDGQLLYRPREHNIDRAPSCLNALAASYSIRALPTSRLA